jgi:hypothetical protein
MPVVVDDATLLAILTGRSSDHLTRLVQEGQVLTTGAWYYRLHRALHDPASSGSLSTQVANLPHAARDALFVALDDLPPQIIIPGPRLLVPVMGALRLRRRVNFLAAEALATALVSGASIRATAIGPPLRDACADLDIAIDVLPPLG